MIKNELANVEIDDEWEELIWKARKMGITIEEVRQFFQEQKNRAFKELQLEKGGYGSRER
ncbi:anti-repressor SinI family protein [Paenibacillus eucommiae]|uniref:Pyoverdine/dityrosine biosynthesis protein Dit1 n=1 Tax=Paenibacillus eucommiae TaxID=1355755 RepID=A0ABS4IUY8_9BACL|nr:anti-repressor SinI family protein [Paenibacillus eucommiae]MBP1990389.1 pyoverdine/dityrosine biosynthesis protein Dit1 [Paenibacillus eucommiae]